MAFADPYLAGAASGWKLIDASTLTGPLELQADIAIVGSGAGGGMAAEVLSLAGLSVILLEEGPLRTSSSFKDMDEGRAYRELYQESAARSTSDGAISILQGRAVGGSTTINWTSSFRTPPQTLAHWAERHAVAGHSMAQMEPWFERVEARLAIAPWARAPNANNGVLQKGFAALGWEWHVIPRNVKGCWDSGVCGFGCPANAKQSMLVSAIPAALDHGATLVHRLRVRRLEFAGDRILGAVGEALGADGRTPTGAGMFIRARHYVVAGGAINSPALLLRSRLPDPHARLGRRTMIHPVVLSMAMMPDRVDGYYGAPQSIASDHFQWKDGATGPMGYKVEVPPLFPGITAGVFNRIGEGLRADMAALPNGHAMLALLRDGFMPLSEGGSVRLAEDGSPVLDYELNDYAWDGARRAYLSMAEAQFAAGAARVRPAHLDAAWFTSWSQAKAAIPALPMKKFRAGLFTAHLMGGCGMSEDPKLGVVDSRGRHHQVPNLSILDGSVFPTSIGANPQLSVYALTSQNASALAREMRA